MVTGKSSQRHRSLGMNLNEETSTRQCSSNCHKMSSFRNSRSRKYHNFLNLLRNRELQENNWRVFSKKTQIFRSAVERLGVLEELKGHCGCVNCIEFNESGNLLLSGSDDFNIILWDVYQRKLLKSISTGHRGNIFSVKFLPQTNNNLIVSGAGDHRIEVREVSSGEATQVCTCHSERVKRIATVPTAPNLFFSASEDGTVMEFDTRMKHTCSSQPNNVLVDLKRHAGGLAECKCVTVHPFRSELIAVGASDPYIRVYDRRMINLTSIQYPPGGSSRTSWERRDYAISQTDASMDNLPPGCVQFYIPGHLPAKRKDYNRKYRSLATTYLSYSTDGVYLLANLGGDHIYLFDTLRAEVPREYTAPIQCNSKPQKACLVAQPNGVCKILETTNGYSNHSTPTDEEPQSPQMSLPSEVEAIKTKAHKAFNAQDYTTALQLYNTAIQMYDNIALLYSARAATLMKRKWEGDIYSALRDCSKAVDLDPSNIKARFRQMKCLHLLGREEETQQCLGNLFAQYPQYPQISTASSWADSEHEKITKSSSSQHNNSGSDSDNEYEGFIVPLITEKEKRWRALAKDYDKVFCGHCNTTTDIKEAVFLGQNGDFIAAGSDDGNLFIWDRHTTNLVRVIEADRSIVNCVQSHPNVSMLATSGIETVVKLWGPLGEVDSDEATSNENLLKITKENQQRMNTDPVEMMFLHMGNFENGIFSGQSNVQCRQA